MPEILIVYRFFAVLLYILSNFAVHCKYCGATVCPICFVHLYKVSLLWEWNKTSWTCGTKYPFLGTPVIKYNCMSLPLSYSNLLYEIGQYFLDWQYKNSLYLYLGGWWELCTHYPRGWNPRDSHVPRGERGALARAQRAGQHRLAVPGSSAAFISVGCWIECLHRLGWFLVCVVVHHETIVANRLK